MKRFLRKKPKKTVKGMTLIECIIALCVFSIAAAVMVETGIVVNRTLQETSHLNRKVSAQSPKAETQNVSSATQEGFSVNVPAGAAKNFTRVVLEVEGTFSPVSILVDTYNTADSSDPDTAMDADLHFVDVDTETYGTDKKGGPLKFEEEIETPTEGEGETP